MSKVKQIIFSLFILNKICVLKLFAYQGKSFNLCRLTLPRNKIQLSSWGQSFSCIVDSDSGFENALSTSHFSNPRQRTQQKGTIQNPQKYFLECLFAPLFSASLSCSQLLLLGTWALEIIQRPRTHSHLQAKCFRKMQLSLCLSSSLPLSLVFLP